jgi:AraC-like DNA-binding protein
MTGFSRGLTSQRVPLPVSTILTSDERIRVDAAGQGLYRTLHRDSVDDVFRDLKSQQVGAVLVSVNQCLPQEAQRMARLVREFPMIPAVALLTDVKRNTPQAVLSLGQCGVRTLIDVRDPSGWRELRNVLLSDPMIPIQRSAVVMITRDLATAPEDCQRFFMALFLSSARVATVRMLARTLQVLPSTLMSRFFRARLPAPKKYLALARLTRAASLFENAGLSVANVANQLEYSSPQSFGRHIRTLLRMTAGQFRDQYDGEGMLNRFRSDLILPFLTTLREFSPLSNPPGWIGNGNPESKSRSNQPS